MSFSAATTTRTLSHMMKGKIRPQAEYVERKEVEMLEAEEWARANDFEVVSIRECDWQLENRRNPLIREYLSQHLLMDKPRPMTTDQLLDKVNRGDFYGYVEVDIEVPQNSDVWTKCEECSPIYRHAFLNQSSGGPHMQ